MIDLFSRRFNRIKAYRRLFLTEGGRLKPEAEVVLSDLYDFTRFFRGGPAEPQALAVLEGGRQVVRHILKSARATDQELNRHFARGEEND